MDLCKDLVCKERLEQGNGLAWPGLVWGFLCAVLSWEQWEHGQGFLGVKEGEMTSTSANGLF